MDGVTADGVRRTRVTCNGAEVSAPQGTSAACRSTTTPGDGAAMLSGSYSSSGSSGSSGSARLSGADEVCIRRAIKTRDRGRRQPAAGSRQSAVVGGRSERSETGKTPYEATLAHAMLPDDGPTGLRRQFV